MIAELIIDSLVSGSAVAAFLYIKNVYLSDDKKRLRLRSSYDAGKPDAFGAYPYLFKHINDDDYGFVCPKCRMRNRITYKICLCDLYPNSHFHFECQSCQFNTIMRAADDVKGFYK